MQRWYALFSRCSRRNAFRYIDRSVAHIYVQILSALCFLKLSFFKFSKEGNAAFKPDFNNVFSKIWIQLRLFDNFSANFFIKQARGRPLFE